MRRRLVTVIDGDICFSTCNGKCKNCAIRFKCITTSDNFLEITYNDFFCCIGNDKVIHYHGG